MAKHLSFWIGFFAAALLIVPTAVGVWGAAGDLTEYVAVFIFGVIAGLVALLILALFFRDAILRRMLGRGEASLHDVTAALVTTISSASTGDRAAAEQSAVLLGQTFAGWWAWANLYRWVIASALGLLLAFGTFTGTVLLFEQNRKLGEQTETLRTQTRALQTQTERVTEQTEFMRSQTGLMQAQTERLRDQIEQAAMQNEILTLSLVSELRNQILASASEVSMEEVFVDADFIGPWGLLAGNEDANCAIGVRESDRLQRPPSRAVIQALVRLARDGRLVEQVREALGFLLTDENGAVALGAYMVLSELGLDDNRVPERFHGLFIEEVTINARGALLFDNSIVTTLRCPDCSIAFEQSIIGQVEAADVLARRSIVFQPEPGSMVGGSVIFEKDFAISELYEEGRLTPLLADIEWVFFTATEPTDVCGELVQMARGSDLLHQFDLGN
ncbi:hypothetical protein [Cognatiyoonia sp. IB215182]|uniref:hypothetical protein n=1 Tax=Cognatiyoonia sp. IB215182 TaxID=3097353 RepID=UPI002A178C0C|nr:hypothetical protein [Cognatiyoonia sp. IB215182]MDX8350772.1 hypothetical protein [Cognatiyoonia sp. IB215182]